MKEVQKFELLKLIREEAQKRLAMVEQSLTSSEEEMVQIENAIIERKRLETFKDTLEKAGKAQTIEDLKELLKEDVIPLEMLIVSESWEELQRLINLLEA